MGIVEFQDTLALCTSIALLVGVIGAVIRFLVVEYGKVVEKLVEGQAAAMEKVALAVGEAIKPRPFLLPEIEEGESGRVFSVVEDAEPEEYPDPTDYALPDPGTPFMRNYG